MNKIFITGASGLLSLNTIIKYNKKYDFTASLNKRDIKLDNYNVNLIKIDLFNKNLVINYLSKLKPDYIFHNVALTDLELCEKNKSLCFKINVDLTSVIVDVCLELGIKLIFISSDQIYSGLKPEYNENSNTDPINYYGISKIKAEEYIQNKLKNFLIIRTNFFAWGPSYRSSFSDRVLLSKSKKIFELSDVYFNPVYFKTLTECIFKLLNKKISGIFNISSDQNYSKFELAKLLLNYFNIKREVTPIFLNEIKSILNRPKIMILSNNKLKTTLGIRSIDMEFCLSSLKSDFENGHFKIIKSI